MNTKDRNLTDYLNDIADNMEAVVNFVKDFNYESFEKDTKTQYAVIKAIEIIGEATRKLPDNFRLKHPNIPWREIEGMRDRLVHDYTGTDVKIVWDTATKDIPKLQKQLEEIL